MLVIIGGFVYLFGCFLPFFKRKFITFYFNNFFILTILFLIFIYLFIIIIFVPFLLSCVADRVLVLRPGVRPEPLRSESRVQDIGRPETSRPHVISVSGSCPRHLHLNAKAQLHSTASKLKCWMPHAKQLERQEHNPTH